MSNNNENKQSGSWLWSGGKTNKAQFNNPIASDRSNDDSDMESEKRLASIFEQLDRNGNGRIDIQELTMASKKLGISQQYAEVG